MSKPTSIVRSISSILLALLLAACEKIDLTTTASPQGTTTTVPGDPSPDTPSWFTDADGTPIIINNDPPVPDGSPSGNIDTLTLDTEIAGEHVTVPEESSSVISCPLITPQGYILALASGNKGLLLSTNEWHDIPSAFSTTSRLQAKDIATNYCELHFRHWQIPTEAQARALKDITPQLLQLHNESSATVPEELSSDITFSPISLTDSQGTNIRYLCTQAERTYSFAPGSTILKAGSTVKYHLRLVHPVIIRKEILPQLHGRALSY